MLEFGARLVHQGVGLGTAFAAAGFGATWSAWHEVERGNDLWVLSGRQPAGGNGTPQDVETITLTGIATKYTMQGPIYIPLSGAVSTTIHNVAPANVIGDEKGVRPEWR